MSTKFQIFIIAGLTFITSSAYANCEAARKNLSGEFSWQGWQQQTMNKECQNLKIIILPSEPSDPLIKQEIKSLSGYDGFGTFCKDGLEWSVLAITSNNGKTYKTTKKVSTERTACTASNMKFRLEPVHEDH